MKRKLIKQGGGGCVVYVPKKWLDFNGLKAGDELNIDENEKGLFLSGLQSKKKKKIISLDISEAKESVIRTMIVNAYRLGFDKIDIKFNGNKKDLSNVVDRFMIGFELFKIDSKKYSAESMSEPSYDNFENIIIKQFYILDEIINDIGKLDISDYVYKVQKYDNFLKRCISKKLFLHPGSMYIWRFLSKLTRVARLFYHLENDIKQNKLSLNKDILSVLNDIKQMIGLLRKSYTKMETSHSLELHNYEQRLIDNLKKKLLTKNSLFYYHLMSIVSEVYLCNSPLIGFIQAERFKIE